MDGTRIDLLLPTAGDEATQAGLVQRAEANGFDRLWVSELWERDALVRASWIATLTESIGVGTAITNVFSRSPAVLAMGGVTLQRLSGGRFVLGVGVSTPKVIEDLHGLDYADPLTRARETIHLVGAYTGGGTEPVTWDGEVFSVADFTPLPETFPIYNAALGPANRRLTGRYCDGWLPHNVPFSTLASRFEAVATGAREADRDPDAITVAPFVPALVGDDPADIHRATGHHIAYYLANGEGYRRSVAGEYPGAVAAVVDAWRDGQRDAAAEAVPEEMLCDLAVVGRPAEARDRLRSLLTEPAVDRIILRCPRRASLEDIERTVAALAPDALSD